MLKTSRFAILLVAAFAAPAFAATTAEIDSVLSWAEKAYPLALPTAGATTGNAYGYTYRYYPETGIYLGAKEDGLDDGLYLYTTAMDAPTQVGSIANLVAVGKSCDFSRPTGGATSALGGKVQVSLEDTSGVTAFEGLKQRFIIENVASAPVYIQLNATATKHRATLMSPQPGYVYLGVGESFQGMIVHSMLDEVEAGTPVGGTVELAASLSLQELDAADGSLIGTTTTVTVAPSFALGESSVIPPPRAGVEQLAYERTATVTTPAGFWRYATDAAQTKIALFPGQEHWTNASDAGLSTLYVYKLDGTLLWQRATGAEVWGGDMTADGNYIAYATLQSSTGPDSLYLLDATTGEEIWNVELNSTNFPRPADFKQPDAHLPREVREVRFSPSGKYVAIGSAGPVFLIDRETREVKWAFETFGQARAITFAADESAMFVGSGDGYLYKIDRASGTQKWKSAIVAWPYGPPTLAPNGTWVSVGVKSGEFTVIDQESGNCLFAHDMGLLNVRRTLFSPDGTMFYAASGTPEGTKAYATLSWTENFKSIMAADISITADSKYLLIADSPTGYLLDARTGQSVATLATGFDASASYFKVIFVSASGEYIVIARRDTSPNAANIAFFRRK